MESMELKEFRQRFADVDRKDTHAIREWFLEYPELTNNEHCLIMQLSEFSILNMKRKAGVTPVFIVEVADECIIQHQCGPNHVGTSRNIDIDICEDWNNYEWLNQHYNKMQIGLPTLSKALGCSYSKLVNALLNCGIILRKEYGVSHNECRTKEWLIENYCDGGLSLRACGRLAGVSHATIRQWLLKFDIEPRGSSEALKCLNRSG